MKSLNYLSLLFVGFYRSLGTMFLGGNCRFEPSCSDYAVQALHNHNFFCAWTLIFKRILKCRPGGAYGLDILPKHNCGDL